MDRLRFSNRHRPTWLWSCSFIVLLLPLTLGQSSAGGCGATVTVPDHDPMDSDGDGFSDDVEINSTPGTDPNDPTDNPSNVRDTDADGCSDYDERNFEGFCDNDPNTPATSCETTYYSPDLRFGFDLPPNAELRDATDNEGGIIFNRYWVFLFEGQVLAVRVYIVEEPPQSLADWVALGLAVDEASGYTLIDAFPFVFDDGTEAYFTSTIRASNKT